MKKESKKKNPRGAGREKKGIVFGFGVIHFIFVEYLGTQKSEI